MVTVPNRSCKAMKHDAKTGERMKCVFTHCLFTRATTFLHLHVSHHSSVDAALILKKGLHCGGIGVIGDHRSIQ